MDIIQLLPDHVANQIAAGEVVQRPASVVKELLENSVDAEANKISLVVKDAGKTLIQVNDNGKGMSMTDARLCFERHATSKIKTADDLFHLNTKGFRGEALASIAAISQVELKSKQAENETGTLIKIEASEVLSQEAWAGPQGTSISVKNLFFNIPARRNFLKSNSVEMRHIIDEFQRVALAHPQIAFSLYHNGNELFQLPISNLRQRIVNIFGAKTNEKLVPVNEETDILSVLGFVGKPEFAKRTRGEQFFFVNDRYIKSPYLQHAVNSAFEGLLREKVHPSYFLYLKVKPESIDINIHPTKTEIKFEDEHALYAIIRSAVKHCLGQFNVAPVLDFDRDADLDTPYSFKDKPVKTPNIEVDRDFNPFKTSGNDIEKKSFPNKKENISGWEEFYSGFTPDRNFESSPDSLEIESGRPEEGFFEKGDHEPQKPTFQLRKKYIVGSLKNGMFILDQHRAHYRILYEEMLKNITVSPAPSQQLLFPLKLHYNTSEIELLQQLKPDLEQTGFVFEEISKKEVVITGIPTAISVESTSNLLENLLADFQDGIPGSGFEQTDLLAKSLARNMAVKAGTVLEETEQIALINSLFACKETDLTPSNRKIFITIDERELDKKFM
ncbi:MAG TPA: DNA mismatch repair endonuclease MutL [Flavobacteriaceae bacterium]|nr:DNA mismatch repair endonuclease MutL [Flavobacteriaceae bacterium]